MADGITHPSGSSANWDRVDQLLFSWLDQPEDQIEQRLAALRVSDPTLAQAMESRLGRLHRLGHLRAGFPPETGPRVGATFGDYRIVRALGQGGMGAVYLAEQQSLKRRVALKVIRGDRLRDQGARDRFRREARAVADLRHPGICGVLDVGEVDDTPFLAMQYIDGETLAERLAAQRAGSAPALDIRAPSTAAEIGSVLQWIELVARSLHAAHEAGVVHRDVKPGNVMIDRAGQPVVLDFGLAHVDSAAGDPTLTLSGDLIGTPAYMSPEQVRPKGRTIDRRTDVYSLGVTLFECLTLVRPFAARDQLALYEQIECEPTPDPRRANPRLPVDVTAVLGKAMEKEPARRYGTAQELAEDLRRILEHKPVRARRISRSQRLWRWCQRNPWAAGLVLALGAGLTTTGLLLRQTSTQRDAITGLAENSRVLALVGAAATEAAVDPMLSLQLAVTAAEAKRTPESLEGVRSSLQAAAEKCLLSGHRHWIRRSMLSRDMTFAVTGSQDGTVRVWDQNGRERHCFDLQSPVSDLALLDGDKHALCTTTDGTVRLLDLEHETTTVLVKIEAAAWAVQPLVDGRIACGLGDGTLRILDASYAPEREFQHRNQVWVVATSPRSARFVATADFRGVVSVFDLDSKDDKPCLELVTGSVVDRIAFSPRRDEILVVDRMGRVVVRNVLEPNGAPVASCRHGRDGSPPARIYDAVWAPDGERFMTVATDHYGRLWRRDGSLESVLGGHTGELYECAVSADGARWATAGDDATVRVWTARGDLLTVLRGHSCAVSGGLSFSRDGNTLLSAAQDSTARLWDLNVEGAPVMNSPAGGFTMSRFVQPGDEIVTTTKEGHIVFWSRAGAFLQDIPLPTPTWVGSMAIDPSGHRMVVGQFEGHLHVVELPSRKVTTWRNPDRNDPATRMVAIDPAGKVLVAKGRWEGHPATLAWTDLELGEQRVVATLPADYVLHAIALDPTGQRIYLAGGDGAIRIYGREGVAGPIAVPPTGNGILGIEFSPDGRLLGATSNDRMARLYDVGPDGSLSERCMLRGHENDVMRIHFAPDGHQAITSSRDATVRVWTTEGALVATIRGHAGFVYDACFSADGTKILSCGSEGTARLWHARPDDLLAAARARLRRGFDAEAQRRYGHLLQPSGR